MLDQPLEVQPPREVAGHLGDLFPGIAPSWRRGADPCWIAWALAQSAEHNPPMYWLGRAFDSLREQPADTRDEINSRLGAAHGAHSCGGHGVEDAALQDRLTEVCALAWAADRLGPAEVIPRVRVDAAGAALTLGIARPQIQNAANSGLSTVVVPCRLQPTRSVDEVMRQVATRADEAATVLAASGSGTRGILYLDIWHERRFAQSIGYRFEITEPVRTAIRHYAPESGLGYVLTRPFEWGRPLEEWA